MAQPSVAREPSMEEILASIRRIIESNEPATSDAFSGHLPPVYDDEGENADDGFAAESVSPPAHVPPAANQGYGARQQTDFGALPDRAELLAERPQENTMSLADVAARVRAAADRNAAMGAQAFAAQRQVEQAPPPPAFQAERAAPVQRPTDVRPLMAASVQARDVSPSGDVPSFAPAPTPAPVATPQIPSWERMELRGAVEPEMSVAHAVEAHVEVPAAPVVENKIEESGLSLNLISAAAGAQIAKSFGELAEVFDGVQRPTIEQLAQDMLRPMLQEWLEDNLPTLVERLVREEIERVARGPRR